VEIRACQGKLISAEAELLRQAKRQKQRLTETDLPYQKDAENLRASAGG
jgi:hypothetical protein